MSLSLSVMRVPHFDHEPAALAAQGSSEVEPVWLFRIAAVLLCACAFDAAIGGVRAPLGGWPIIMVGLPTGG